MTFAFEGEHDSARPVTEPVPPPPRARAAAVTGASGGGTASGVVVREASTDDATAMVMLRAVMFEAMGTPPDQLADDTWRRAARDWFVERTAAPGVRVVVAEIDGQVVAGAVGEVTALIPAPTTPNGRVGLISNVATLPRHRGRGLASAVTDDLLAWFAERTDVTRVDLFATQEGARIYRPRGFSQSAFPSMRLPLPR